LYETSRSVLLGRVGRGGDQLVVPALDGQLLAKRLDGFPKAADRGGESFHGGRETLGPFRVFMVGVDRRQLAERIADLGQLGLG